MIAYEPIWAIGTGRTATPDDAQAVCAAVRSAVSADYGADAGDGVRIQYGGSVQAGNIAALMAQPDIDGALVGGASLDPDEFAQIVTFGKADEVASWNSCDKAESEYNTDVSLIYHFGCYVSSAA